uniref:Uncharacterized protein n=1 Tax=Sus scrofa TaxID=9823 RepID=A0A8D1JWN6_PIG
MADRSFLFGSRSSKTFKPKRNIPEGSHQYELLKHAEATLGSGNLWMAAVLPEGEELNEWVAHFIFFVQEFNLIERRELVPLQELIEKLTSKDK